MRWIKVEAFIFHWFHLLKPHHSGRKDREEKYDESISEIVEEIVTIYAMCSVNQSVCVICLSIVSPPWIHIKPSYKALHILSIHMLWWPQTENGETVHKKHCYWTYMESCIHQTIKCVLHKKSVQTYGLFYIQSMLILAPQCSSFIINIHITVVQLLF